MNTDKTSDPTDENHVYSLPAPVVMAISSGRAVMLVPYINDVKEGKAKLTKKMQVELLELLQGFISDNYKLKQENESLKETHAHVVEQARVAADASRSIVKTLEDRE